MAAEQAATGASALAAVNPGDAAVFKGVSFNSKARTPAGFDAYSGGRVSSLLGSFCTAEEAARAYDDTRRKAGRRAVNFPRPGTDEVQAVKGEREEVTLMCAAGKRAPPRSGPLPPAPGYKGVHVDATIRTAAVFDARLRDGRVLKTLGHFCTAEEAARAYDDAVRKVGRRVVNFPRPDTDEVQSVKGEKERITLARHAAAQQAAGGAGGAGAVTPPDNASPPPKRRAAASPPWEPPRKRATAPSVKPAVAAPEAPAAAAATPLPPQYTRRPPHRIERENSLPPGFVAPVAGIKTESPAAVKAETPVAPPPAPFTRRPPHRIETAASPPPEPDAPATRIKLESPAAVKPETPAAPPMPAVAASGCPSPTPPPASAAAAPPPVKMERDPASDAAFHQQGGPQRGSQ